MPCFAAVSTVSPNGKNASDANTAPLAASRLVQEQFLQNLRDSFDRPNSRVRFSLEIKIALILHVLRVSMQI